MASVLTPTLPVTGPWLIDREDCIGDSLQYINANANNFAYRLNQIIQPLEREILYVNNSGGSNTWRSISVTNNGNDSTGTGSTSAPFLTLTGALQYVYQRDIARSRFVEIRLCPGSYVGATVSGMPAGSGRIGSSATTRSSVDANLHFPTLSEPTVLGGNISIAGSSKSNTYITQVQTDAVPRPFWSHLRFENGANFDVTEVTFRYNTGSPLTFPTSTLVDYNVIRVDGNSSVYISDCTFEPVPNVLTLDATPASHTKYVLVTNNGEAVLRNIIIDGTNPRLANGSVTTNYSMGRYFAQTATGGGKIYFFGTCTLQNSPRINVFVEPTVSHGIIYFNSDTAHPFGQFSWSGNFGTQLGSGGGNQAFQGVIDYQPLQAKNYILKDDGPFAYILLRTSGQPANSYLYSYVTVSGANAARFSFVSPW